jgi:hypothetical protein
MPKKPPRFPSHLVFPKKGPVRPVTEALPRSQRELELAIGHKFLGALRHFHNVRFGNLSYGVEPADLHAVDDRGIQVHIQIVEAVNSCLIQLTEMRKTYLSALRDDSEQIFDQFSGCSVKIVDTGDPPYLPNINTRIGQQVYTQIRQKIVEIGESIGDLPVGRLTHRQMQVIEPFRSLSLLITRYEEPSTVERFVLDWSGAGPSYQIDLPRDILPAAVRSKLKKHNTPTEGRFILLVYSIDTLFTEDDPDIGESHRLLSTKPHPFDEAWYLYPYAEHELGHLIQLLPREGPG